MRPWPTHQVATDQRKPGIDIRGAGQGADAQVGNVLPERVIEGAERLVKGASHGPDVPELRASRPSSWRLGLSTSKMQRVKRS